MPIIPFWLEKNIKSISEIITFATKIGVLFGGTIFISYMLKISHFPQGLSAGDAVYFLFFTVCFGLTALLLCAGLYSCGFFLIYLGLLVLWLIKFATRLHPCLGLLRRWIQIERWFYFFYGNSNFLTRETFLSKIVYCVLRAFFVFFIFVCSYPLIRIVFKQELSNYVLFLVLSLFLFICHPAYRRLTDKINENERNNNPFYYHEKKIRPAKPINHSDLCKARNLIIPSALIFVLFVSNKYGELLELSMRAAQIRIEKAVVYIKEPYSILLPKFLALKDKVKPKDYSSFHEIDVFFKGIGNTTVISFKDGDKRKQLEIPNDNIIIEKWKIIDSVNQPNSPKEAENKPAKN